VDYNVLWEKNDPVFFQMQNSVRIPFSGISWGGVSAFYICHNISFLHYSMLLLDASLFKYTVEVDIKIMCKKTLIIHFHKFPQGMKFGLL